MFCIAAFIVLAIISVFSASQRKLAKKAWDCTLHRITFRPCDTTFKEELKDKMLSRVARKKPKLVHLADIGIEVGSFLLVILTVWSILVVLESGLNLFVWGTCTPNQASSCSLTSETCSIDKVEKSFWILTSEGKPYLWFVNKFESLADTFANIPNRIKTWNATDYLPANVSYYNKYDSSKPVALEVLDPGCFVCAKLFRTVKSSGFENKYNLAYIAYPISNINQEGKYKYQNSYLIAKYLEALKLNKLSDQKIPSDWQIIERMFSWKTDSGIYYQQKINDMEEFQVIALLHEWLTDIGYGASQIQTIDNVANSQLVTKLIDQNRQIVEKKISTVKIPTMIYDGHRRDGFSGNDL